MTKATRINVATSEQDEIELTAELEEAIEAFEEIKRLMSRAAKKNPPKACWIRGRLYIRCKDGIIREAESEEQANEWLAEWAS